MDDTQNEENVSEETDEYLCRVSEARTEGEMAAAFYEAVKHLGPEVATELTAQWLNVGPEAEEDEDD